MASSLLVLIRGRISRTDSGLWPKPQHGFLSQSALGIAQEGEKKEASSTAAARPSYSKPQRDRLNKAVC